MPEGQGPRLVWFRAKWAAYLGNGRRVSLGTTDRAEAERRLKNLTGAIAGKAKTVGAIVALYLEEADRTHARPKRAHDAWARLKSQAGHLEPASINRAWCLAYTTARRHAGVKDATITAELGVLRAALRWHDPRTPAIIETPGSSPPRERWLTRQEADRLLDAAIAPHLKLFIEIALRTAARTEAILSLTWDRVDLNRMTIDYRIVDGGRRKGRVVAPINARLAEVLKTAQAVSVSPYVIEWGGKRVKRILKGFRETAGRAGLKDVTPHTLRHTAASWMVAGGVPIEDVARLLGHSDPALTFRIYAKVAPEHLRGAVKALE